MEPLVLVLLPTIAGTLALAVRRLRLQIGCLLTASAGHLALCAWLWFGRRRPSLGEALAIDDLGLLALAVTSVLFFLSSLYSIPYLKEGTHDVQSSPQRFAPRMLFYLAAMTLVCATHHMGLMWAAVEATTLASAPLVYFYRRKRALEAAWKYLLICSVGIALALLGVFFLALAASAGDGAAPAMTLEALQARAPQMSPSLLAIAFAFALVGYGVKMGLAPLHTWLPDAHSQAPTPVSALMSGAALNCALVALLRFHQVCVAGGNGDRVRPMLLALGFLSMGVAVAFMVGQKDYKRLLAYSSVENMGAIVVGIGLGGAALYGALFHMVLHSFAKAGLFFVSGNLLREYGSTEARSVTGALRRLPASGALLVALLFAIGGSPPFGLFMSEYVIFMGAMADGRTLCGVAFIILLAVGFIGAAGVVLPMAQGEPERRRDVREPLLKVFPPLALCLAVLALGLTAPSWLGETLQRAAFALGGSPP